MLQTLNDLILSAADPVLGWLLHLPADLALIIVALGTSAILTFVRLFTTNQDLLGRCHQDKKRLKTLMREAKRNRDKAARKRMRTTVGQVSMKLMRAEFKPLLASILPIAFLAVWCFSRLAYVPPKVGEPVVVKAYFKVSTIGDTVHMLPEEGLSLAEVPLDDVVKAEVAQDATVGGSWIQRVHDDPDTAGGAQRNGLAVWRLTPDGSRSDYTLAIRYAGRTYERPLVVGEPTYAPWLVNYGADDPVVCAEVVMDELKLFGFVPGIPAILFPPWLVAYLAVAIPFVFILKRLFHIH